MIAPAPMFGAFRGTEAEGERPGAVAIHVNICIILYCGLYGGGSGGLATLEWKRQDRRGRPRRRFTSRITPKRIRAKHGLDRKILRRKR
jgi:hypothetical protein